MANATPFDYQRSGAMATPSHASKPFCRERVLLSRNIDLATARMPSESRDEACESLASVQSRRCTQSYVRELG